MRMIKRTAFQIQHVPADHESPAEETLSVNSSVKTNNHNIALHIIRLCTFRHHVRCLCNYLQTAKKKLYDRTQNRYFKEIWPLLTFIVRTHLHFFVNYT